MLRDRIKAAQSRDPILVELEENVRSGKFTDFTLDDEGVLWISGRLCVPNVDNMREEILEEAHFAAYSVYPGTPAWLREAKFGIWVHCKLQNTLLQESLLSDYPHQEHTIFH